MKPITYNLLNFFINGIAIIFLAMTAIILTYDFQEIILDAEIVFKIYSSVFWVFGLMIVLLKAFSINWSIIFRR